MKTKIKKQLTELEFARCPVETEDPFFWKWTDEALDVLSDFALAEHERGYERGKAETIAEKIGTRFGKALKKL